MDSELAELKRELVALRKTTEETNHLVHKMRRNQIWSSIFRIVWWLVVAGVMGAVYYYFLAPYVEQLLHIYGSASQVLQQFH